MLKCLLGCRLGRGTLEWSRSSGGLLFKLGGGACGGGGGGGGTGDTGGGGDAERRERGSERVGVGGETDGGGID